jgi:hypothetical protein
MLTSESLTATLALVAEVEGPCTVVLQDDSVVYVSGNRTWTEVLLSPCPCCKAVVIVPALREGICQCGGH